MAMVRYLKLNWFAKLRVCRAGINFCKMGRLFALYVYVCVDGMSGNLLPNYMTLYACVCV